MTMRTDKPAKPGSQREKIETLLAQHGKETTYKMALEAVGDRLCRRHFNFVKQNWLDLLKPKKSLPIPRPRGVLRKTKPKPERHYDLDTIVKVRSLMSTIGKEALKTLIDAL